MKLLTRLKGILGLLMFSLGCLTLAGCGYQLSGYQPTPDSAKQVSLVLSSDTPPALERALKGSLRQRGILISADAPYQLSIIKVEQNRRSITLDSSANVDEYELLMQVSFEVIGRDKKSITGTLKAFTEKILDYDANAETASATLERTIKREMWQTLAERIVRQFVARAR